MRPDLDIGSDTDDIEIYALSREVSIVLNLRCASYCFQSSRRWYFQHSNTHLTHSTNPARSGTVGIILMSSMLPTFALKTSLKSTRVRTVSKIEENSFLPSPSIHVDIHHYLVVCSILFPPSLFSILYCCHLSYD